MKASWAHITLSFLSLFIYNLEDVLAAPIRHLCRPEQRDALLEFKNEFKIGMPLLGCPNVHPKTESWTNNSDCCNWKGITCNAKFGKVIELNLTCSGLHGRFHSSSSLQNLYLLTTLDLSYNNIIGQIPSSVGNLSQLTSLHLTYNQFAGQIPSSIGNLSQLTSLELSQNQFLGQIPSSIGNLYKLTSLDLSYNNFTCEIPSSFGNLNQLTLLGISSNKLSGKIPSALLNLRELLALSLEDNQFTGTLPPNFTSLSNLEYFDANDNAFTGALPSSLVTIPCLEILRLENNQLNEILEFGNISSPSKPLRLYLGNNNFKGPIPSSISKLTNLVELDLSHFNTQGPIDFGIFSHLKSLQHLDLSHLNTTTWVDLNDILSCSKSLSLDLSGTNVSSTNKISVSDPPWQSMEYLNLSSCGITDFPEILRSQQFMSRLDISNNNIKGHVPGWLWTLPKLEYVNLSNNTFTAFENSTKPGLSSVLKPSTRQQFHGQDSIFHMLTALHGNS